MKGGGVVMSDAAEKKKSKNPKREALMELGAKMEAIAVELWEQRHVTEGQSWYDLCDIVALLKGFNKRATAGDYP
jgi:hypothetical protein